MMLMTYISYTITLLCVGALVSIAISLVRVVRLLRKIDLQNFLAQSVNPAPTPIATATAETKLEPKVEDTKILDDEKRLAIFRAAATEFLGAKVHVFKFREAGQVDWILNGSLEPKQG